jgi:hypothetical protein
VEKNGLMHMTDAIEDLLKKKMTLHRVGCWVGSVLAFLVGALVLFLTFWFAYLVLFLGQWGISAFTDLCFNRKFHISHAWRLILCGLFLAVLFIEWLRRRHTELGNYGRINSPPGAQALVFHDGALGAFAALLANPQTSATIIAEILYTGPRLIIGAGSLMREANRSRHFDLPGCAQILQCMLAKPGALTYEELNTTKSDFEQTKLQTNLAQIPGIVFLEKGLGLTEELRRELSELT